MRSYVAVDDVGRAVNPLIVEGEIHGGVTQGLAQALYEEGCRTSGRARIELADVLMRARAGAVTLAL